MRNCVESWITNVDGNLEARRGGSTGRQADNRASNIGFNERLSGAGCCTALNTVRLDQVERWQRGQIEVVRTKVVPDQRDLPRGNAKVARSVRASGPPLADRQLWRRVGLDRALEA